jgi:hypothetical protein
MNRTNAKSPAVTPAKLAAIAVLALVLVAILVFQFSGPSEGASLKKRSPKSPVSVASDPAAASSTSPAGPHRLRWPEIQREEVLAFNPFAIPEVLAKSNGTATAQTSQPIQVSQASDSASAQPTVPNSGEPNPNPQAEQARMRAQERKSRINRIRATAAELQQRGVAVVMSTSAGAVARIGEDEVRVGDIINGVLRVVKITPQGIVIEEEPEELPQTQPE